MQKLLTAEAIRTYESELIKKMSSDFSLTLMERAGVGLANVVKNYSEPYLFICGKGNNGGDGLVAARCLHGLGKKVFIILTSKDSSLSQDARVNFEKIKTLVLYTIIETKDDEMLYKKLAEANTIVDCLLGTGATKEPSSLFEWIIKSINNSNKRVVACDIPTGLYPDTGNVSTHTIKANCTVTFGYSKIGLLLYPGKEYVGNVKVVDIGLPDIDSNISLLDDDFVKANLPSRKNTSNKGTFGKTLLVCGSYKYPGAALLASKAAASTGSGLTALSSPKEVFEQITKAIPEVTHVDFDTKEILDEGQTANVMVVGPGLSCTREIEDLVIQIITQTNIPIVLDADGINVLAGKSSILKDVKKEIILTPHPKELARLLGKNTEDILNDKINIAMSTAKEFNCTLVLKGPGTIIATKDGKIYISPFANSALAKGGTGDVLAGFIGGLIAQGLQSDIATCLGVYLHGKAGELVSNDKTVFSLLPQDLITYLPQVLKIYI